MIPKSKMNLNSYKTLSKTLQILVDFFSLLIKNYLKKTEVFENLTIKHSLIVIILFKLYYCFIYNVLFILTKIFVI